jgi:hypothetical protein
MLIVAVKPKSQIMYYWPLLGFVSQKTLRFSFRNSSICHPEPFAVILSAAKNLLLPSAQGRLREGPAFSSPVPYSLFPIPFFSPPAASMIACGSEGQQIIPREPRIPNWDTPKPIKANLKPKPILEMPGNRQLAAANPIFLLFDHFSNCCIPVAQTLRFSKSAARYSENMQECPSPPRCNRLQ